MKKVLELSAVISVEAAPAHHKEPLDDKEPDKEPQGSDGQNKQSIEVQKSMLIPWQAPQTELRSRVSCHQV